MDSNSNKSWLWKKKPSEKALDTDEIVRKYLKDSHYEDLKPGKNAVSTNCKLGPQECDCNAKDDLVSIHMKMAEEAIAGKEAAEAEVLVLKRELGEALDVRVAAEERLAQLDAALKQCTEQLIIFKEGHEEKVQAAVANKSKAYEGKQRFLEEKFVAACRRADTLATENASLSKKLREKEKLVEDLLGSKSQSEAEFDVLMARVDSTEKENSFLRYEFRMLEKELEIRSVEREYSRALAEGLQTQQLESVKKITKLESECQRLNALLRKRLQTPVALNKMKSEMEMLRRDPNDVSRRRKSNTANGTLVTRNAILESSNEIPSKKAAILIDRLCGLEDEVKSLQALLSNKEGELQDHRIMISSLSTKLAEAEGQLSKISLSEKDSMEIVKFTALSNEYSLSSGFDTIADDKTSDSGSLGYGPSADQEKFKLQNSQENKMLGVSDMNLMDDFVEMEKLAMVSFELSAKLTGKELVPVSQDEFSFSETSSADASSRRSHDWLQDVLKAITEEHRNSKRSIVDLLADINIVFGNSKHAAAETQAVRSVNETNPNCLALMCFAPHDTNFSKSIHTIIELIEGISPATASQGSPSDAERLSEYTLRVFQWRSSELNFVLKQFSTACNDLLSGNKDLGNLAQEVAVVLDWLICNSADHQDALTAHDSIKKIHTPVSAVEKEWTYTPTSSILPEVRGPKPELKGIERARKSLDAKLNSARSDSKNDSLVAQLRESEQIIEQLQIELETLRYSKGIAEDQTEMQKSANEDLTTQLRLANDKLNEVLQQYSSLEMELESKSSSCEHLEATCLDLQLQLESSDRKISGEPCKSLSEGTDTLTGWELVATSATVNSGGELKALNSARETAIMNQAVSNSLVNKAQNKRSSLRDQLLADKNKTANEAQKSVNNQDAEGKGQKQALPLVPSNTTIILESPLADLSPLNKPGNLAIVLSRKNSSCNSGGGGGFLRRLLMRKKKKGNTRKTSLTFGIV